MSVWTVRKGKVYRNGQAMSAAKVVQELERKTRRVNALEDIRFWYEDQCDRSCQDDDDIDADLLAAEHEADANMP